MGVTQAIRALKINQAKKFWGGTTLPAKVGSRHNREPGQGNGEGQDATHPRAKGVGILIRAEGNSAHRSDRFQKSRGNENGHRGDACAAKS